MYLLVLYRYHSACSPCEQVTSFLCLALSVCPPPNWYTSVNIIMFLRILKCVQIWNNLVFFFFQNSRVASLKGEDLYLFTQYQFPIMYIFLLALLSNDLFDSRSWRIYEAHNPVVRLRLT